MCLIIYSPIGSTIPLEHIEVAAINNPDGIGVSYQYHACSTVYIRKYLTLKEFLQSCQTLLSDPTIKMVVHLRYATQGSVKIENCHPFLVQQKYAVHHNGCIVGMPKIDDMTDSEGYCKLMLEKTALQYKNNRDYIANQLSGSKLVLHSQDDVYIINEQSGDWLDGCWYSNDSYLKYESIYLDAESVYCPHCLTLNDDMEDICNFCFKDLIYPNDWVLEYLNNYTAQ